MSAPRRSRLAWIERIAWMACLLVTASLPVGPSTLGVARAEAKVVPRKVAVRVDPARLPAPLSSIVPGTLLVHRRPGELPRPIAGAHFVTSLADGTERWELDARARALEARAS